MAATAALGPWRLVSATRPTLGDCPGPIMRLALSLLLSSPAAAAAAAPVLKIVTAGWDDPCREDSYCSVDQVPRFAVQRSTVAALTGTGFTAAGSILPRCRLTPSGGAWNFGGGELSATLYANLSILNDTHAQCTLPNASFFGLDTPLPQDTRACRDDGGKLPCKAFAHGKLCNDSALIGVGSDRDSVAACYDWCRQDSACRFFSLSSPGGKSARGSSRAHPDIPSISAPQLCADRLVHSVLGMPPANDQRPELHNLPTGERWTESGTDSGTPRRRTFCGGPWHNRRQCRRPGLVQRVQNRLCQPLLRGAGASPLHQRTRGPPSLHLRRDDVVAAVRPK